jgi:NADH dehydrogenase/NADH:ubiquinone oxidoreductase subunit G
VEVGGVSGLGLLGRGINSQIGPYLDKAFFSEISGNVIDLCPVGALTSKPYLFNDRPWKLKSITSIDLSDSFGSSIILNLKGMEVFRILPRSNININGEWISDKTRFSFDGLKIQRLEFPLYRDLELAILSWSNAFSAFSSKIFKDTYNLDKKLNIIFGKDSDLESILSLKYYFNGLNCFSLYSENNFCTNSSDIFYKFNSQIKGIVANDFCSLVNCNTRFESSMLNLHLRQAVTKGRLSLVYFGCFMDLTFNIKHLGFNNFTFFDFIKGNHYFSRSIQKVSNSLFLVNSDSFSNSELVYINYIILKNLYVTNSYFNLLNIEASSVSLREVGLNGIERLNSSCFYLFINTNLNKSFINFLLKSNPFSIYCGSHGVYEVNKVNLVLPGKAYIEKKASYINLEGLLQHTNKSLIDFSNSREDWKIFNAFFLYLGGITGFKFLFFLNLDFLQYFFRNEYPFLAKNGFYNRALIFSIIGLNLFSKPNYFYKSRVLNFFKTNIISSFSRVMGRCYNYIIKKNFAVNECSRL